MRNKVFLLLFFLFLLSPSSLAWLEKTPLEVSTVPQQGYPPAIVSQSFGVEVFFVEADNYLTCYEFNAQGECVERQNIKKLPFAVAYLGVKKESFGYLLYMASSAPAGEREWRILLLDEEKELISFFGQQAPLSQPQDLEVLVVDDTLNVFTVEERDPVLYWRRYSFSGEEREEKQIIAQHLHVGVPRGLVQENTIYLTWRRSQRYNGFLGYAIFQEGQRIQGGDLGAFPYLYIMGLDTRPLVEEVGPSLVHREGGGFWAAWTHSYYADFREWSTIQILEVDSTGQRLEAYTITGQDGFAIYPSLWEDEQGQLHVAWEEKVGTGFDIFYTSLEGGEIHPQRITWSYSHHRLVSGFSILDGLGFVGRVHRKEGDGIWYKSSFFPQKTGLINFGIFGQTPLEKWGEIFLSFLFLVLPLLLYLGGHWPLFLFLTLLLLLLRFLGILSSKPLGVLLPGILGILLILGRLFSFQPPVFFLQEVGEPLLAYSQILSTVLLLFYTRSRAQEVFDEVAYLGYGLYWFFLSGVIAFFWQAGFLLTP